MMNKVRRHLSYRRSIRVYFSFLLGLPVLLASLFPLCGQDNEPTIRFVGIVSFSTNELALLEVNKSSLRRPWDSIILAPGQREEDVEVLGIDVKARTVRTRRGNEVKEFTLDKENESGITVQASASGQNTGWFAEPASIHLRQIRRDQLFILYQMLVGRSLIHPSALPAFELDLDSPEQVTIGDVVHGIERALANKGIFFQSDGDKFVIAGREGDAARITAEVRQSAAQLALPWSSNATERTERAEVSNKPTNGSGEEILPAGAINFPSTDLNQVLQIFQELVNRTLLRPATLPSPIISFRTYTPLNRREVTYALAACFALNGISVLPVGDKFVLAFATAEKQRTATLLARKVPDSNTAGQKLLPDEIISPRGAGLPEIVSLYEKVSGEAIRVEPGLAAPWFFLRPQTPLTPTEVRYALDLLLGWSGLAVVPQENGTGLKLVHADRVRPEVSR